MNKNRFDDREEGVRELADLIARRTGYRAGDIAVTCPNCQVSLRGKFCGLCGREVTALNYEVLIHAIQRRDITHDELMEGMERIRLFSMGAAHADRAFEEDRERRIMMTDLME